MAISAEPNGLSFPRATFAQLAPNLFLQAHLSEQAQQRPNGRQVDEFRQPVINTGSLSHSNGSAVVRLGDTAVVCGIRGEILLASDIPNPPKDPSNDNLEELGLLVPNIELSTGCSQAHLPGNPPSSLAQSLSWRLHTLLHASTIIDISQLQIQHTPAISDDDDEELKPVTKAYWTLYIDILCMSLDGVCFDAAWLAMIAALQNTRLPRAYWDVDNEIILCSPHASEAKHLRLITPAMPSSFAVFCTASPVKQLGNGQSWTLADPDTFEENACREVITISTIDQHIVRIEKTGGSTIGVQELGKCIELARQRYHQLHASLQRG